MGRQPPEQEDGTHGPRLQRPPRRRALPRPRCGQLDDQRARRAPEAEHAPPRCGERHDAQVHPGSPRARADVVPPQRACQGAEDVEGGRARGAGCRRHAGITRAGDGRGGATGPGRRTRAPSAPLAHSQEPAGRCGSGGARRCVMTVASAAGAHEYSDRLAHPLYCGTCSWRRRSISSANTAGLVLHRAKYARAQFLHTTLARRTSPVRARGCYILVVRYLGRATAPEFYIKTDKEGAARLLDLEALEREEEGAARWDAPGREPVGTVALVRRDLEQPHLADLHAEASLVPASNHATDTSLIRERLLPRVLGRPELLVGLLHHACRVDGHGVARLDLGCARMVVARGLRR
mmetsp:Transcript_12353/g.28938  ORF Transcript_12353/g.28938 Transcript_12353/m.28938 type:complete len:350 (+) Transcript_12353:109-1158(+)